MKLERNTSVEFQVTRQPQHSPLRMDVDGHEICDTQGSLYIFLPYGHFLFLEVVDSDPHSFGCPGSGSVLGIRIRIQEHGNRPKFTKTWFPAFQNGFCSFVLRRY
jgi:hypothetical protein